MQHTNGVSPHCFEAELIARYQADLSGAHARAYLREVRERDDHSQSSLDQQIDALLAQWRYSLLDVALAKQSTIPPLDLLKALIVIEAYDQAIALTEHSLETLSISRADVFFDLGIFCLDQDPDHPKASLFFQHAFQSFIQDKPDEGSDVVSKALSFAKRLLDWKRMTEATLYLEIALQIWKQDAWNDFSSIEAQLIWTLAELGFWNQAEEMLAAQPKNPYFLAGFGAALLSAGQMERAENCLKQVCILVEQDGKDCHYDLGWILWFLIHRHYWQWALTLSSYAGEGSYTSYASAIFDESLKVHAWRVAEQICNLEPEPSNINILLSCLVAYLLQQGHYLEAERVARRISEGSYHRDSAFKEIITGYAVVQIWSDFRGSSRFLPNLEEHPASLSSYLEMWIQEGALAEASELLEEISRVDDRLIVEIQLALAYHKQDPNTNVQVALNDLEARLIQLESELQNPQGVWYELAAAYAKRGFSEDLRRAMTRLRANERRINVYLRLRAAWFLEQLLDQDEWQAAEQYACSVHNLKLRSALLARLCLLAARRKNRSEVLRLTQLNVMTCWQETYYDKISWLLYYLVDAYIKAGFLNEAKQLIPLIPESGLRQEKISQLISAFIQKQNWNEALILLEAHQNLDQTPQFYKQLYLGMRRAGQSKRAEELYRTDYFQHNLQKSDGSWQGYKNYKRASLLIAQPIARQQWRKAERLILQARPGYQPDLYNDLARALLPTKRWNELIRITSFVENDTSMQDWHRLEAYQRLIRALGKAGRWQQALRVIGMLETAEQQNSEEPPLQKNLIIVLMEELTARSLLKQALSVYNKISDPENRLEASFLIMIALGKANKWQQVEQLLPDIDGSLVSEYSLTLADLINQLLLLCHRYQRYAILERLCEWRERFSDAGYTYSTYLTTLCQIGRLDNAEALIAPLHKSYLVCLVEGFLKIKAFERAEKLALKLDEESAYTAIAETYTRQKAWDRLVRFADRAIRQADSYDKIQACQPLIMSLIALRPKKAQRMVDLLKQELAFEQRLWALE